MRLLPALAACALALPALLAAQEPGARPAMLTLPDAIAIAQRQSPAARAAEAARDQVRFGTRAFRARLLPQLTFNGTAPEYNRDIGPVVQPDGTIQYRSRRQIESSANLALLQPIPSLGSSFGVQSGIQRFELMGRPETRQYNTMPLSLVYVQDILRPRNLRWEAREQGLAADAAERRWAEAKEDVAVATVDRFFDAWAASVSARNAAANAAVNDTLYTLNKGRYEVGRIGENDLLQSELALLRARAALDGARLEEERARAALRIALDLPPGVALDLTPPATFPAAVPDTSVAVRQALANRSRLVELELEDVRARRGISEARLLNGFNARLVASMGFNRSAGDFGDAYRELEDQQRASLSLQMPLWQWGAGRNDVAAARAGRERVEHATRQARLETEQEAHFAALQFAQSQRLLVIAEKADTVAAKRFEVARQRYLIGRVGVTELFIAQQEKDAAVEAYVRALRAYWRDWYRLRRLTLWDFEAGQPLR